MSRPANLVDATLIARLEMVETLARRARNRLSELRRGGELPVGPGALAEVRAAFCDLASELPDLGRGLGKLLEALEPGAEGLGAPATSPERRRNKLRTA